VFLLLPLRAQRSLWREIPYKRHAALYFAALGLGFMFLEVSMIQRLTLFLGYPTYSLTVTLFALLISTGVGSLVSERWTTPANRRLGVLAAVLVLIVAAYLLLLPVLVQHGIGWPFTLRVGVAVASLAPLGLCLGIFMPLGLRTIAALTPHHEAYVAWAWAVNVFFSVVASVLSTILAMTVGFAAVMVTALVIYLVGITALRAIPTSPAHCT
jgi:MFS family permease